MVRVDPKKCLSQITKNYELYLFLLPALTYYIIFHYLPIYGVQIAFKDFIATLGIVDSPWVGLKHFNRFITGPNFINLVRNTLVISFGTLFIGFPVSVIWALILNELPIAWFKKTAQTISYLPYFISMVVMASMVVIFLNPNYGLVNKLIGIFNIGPYDFMMVSIWFPSIYIISHIWQMTGWNSIVFLSSLSGVDEQLHEAAKIDGATRLQRIRHINFPHILPTIAIMFIMATGRVMTVGFEKAFLLQNNLNLTHSEIISTYVYKVGLLQVQYSFSSAVGLFNSLINFILLFTMNIVSRKITETSLW